MQKFIAKYGLAAHLAILAVAPLFLSPIPVLCLSLLGFIWVLLEPSRIGNEMLHDARGRVLRGMVRDPVFWVMLFLVAFAGIRALNGGVCMAYDAEISKWYIHAPEAPLLPGSVDGAALPLFTGAVALFVLMQGCRHALGRFARFAMLLGLVFFVGSGMLVEGFGELKPCELVNPCYRGVAAGLSLIISLPVLTAVFERRWWFTLPVVMIGIMGSAVGLFLFTPPIVTVAFVGGVVIVELYNFLYLRIRIGKLADFRHLVVFALPLAMAAVFVIQLLPEADLIARLGSFESGKLLPEEFEKLRAILSQVCLKVWRTSPWLGSGLGSFPIDLRFNATAFDWDVISPLQAAPLNGYWLLLVERGVVGAFVLAVMGVMLLVSFIHRFALAINRLPHPLCPAGVVLLIIAALEMVGDCSFMMTENLILLVTIFTLSANAFSKGE